MKTVTAYIKQEVQRGWEKKVYEYENEEQQMAGFEQIGKELEDMMRNKEIVTFQLEANR